MTNAVVTLGCDRLLASDRLVGRRVGLVANPASVNGAWQHTADRLAGRTDVTLAALFGPQHGFLSSDQDNMIETAHARHPRLGVPVYSLYSDTREPSAEMLADLDLLVVDLQDVGTRVYTYVYTMANCLRAARAHDLPVVVCDRPNPIGGVAVEGPMLEPAFTSFVGQFPIPLRHGLTVGELARLFNDAFGLGATLEVVEMTGWRRSMYHDETGLPWILPSPNLPTLDSAIVYPGGVLFEGTTASEGRGTTRPFELLGAPGTDGDALCERLSALALPGVHFRPVGFEPTFQKHVGRLCGGCQIHVVDRLVFEPVRTAVAVMQTMRRQRPDTLQWRDPPYEYEPVKPPIDILSGSDRLRAQLDANDDADAIAASWREGVDAFRALATPVHLYD